MAINTNYLGLELCSPLIGASSPLTNSADKLVKLEQHGAGAVVLKSIFEEQIEGEAAFLETYNDYPEAADYLSAYIKDDQLKGHLNLVEEAKRRIGIPVIASINCHAAGSWSDYAKSLENAGADALELNIYILPTDANETAAQIEARYLEIVDEVTSKTGIPVAVKLSSRFTNIINFGRELQFRNVKGAVLFNRFFEPDIDIDTMTLIPGDSTSARTELHKNLRTVGIFAAKLPSMDISVSTGVHRPEDVVKSILAGAKAVQLCTTLFQNGLDIIGQMNDYLEQWMNRQSFSTVYEFSGKLNYHSLGNEELYQRAQYMRFFPKG